MNRTMEPLRVGADIGGTFTDLVFFCADGTLHKRKIPSTPADYSDAIMTGVSAFCEEHGLAPDRITEIVHATTIATNAILERKGARTALLTTEGFRDVLELRRIRIPMSYDLAWQKPPPLVGREFRLEVEERINAFGTVIKALKPESLDLVLSQLEELQVEAVAVCLLHSYRNSSHEKMVGNILRQKCPGIHVSLSHEILPEMLEFERTSTTVVNAYVAPIIGNYLKSLRVRLLGQGVSAPILVMQSNGGLISATAAVERSVTIIESGPAAGVVAAARIAREGGYPNIITLDMGGTTTKASIIEDGEMLRATEYEVGSAVSISSRLMRGNGYTLRIPVIDVSEVGAGGGSIAHVDAGGSLRVGPRSAGAVPGPACYGQGNGQPTLTDANLVLGYLHEDSLAGGTLRVQRALAEAAIRRHLTEKSTLSIMEAAFGVHVVANSNMVRAIKSVSVERGRDPADFTMMAFGGSGPIQAAGVARELGIMRVLIPPSPGVFSAFGLLRAKVEQHASRTILAETAQVNVGDIQYALDVMETELAGRLTDEGYSKDSVTLKAFFDLRYRGQSSEITVPIAGVKITAQELHAAEMRFEEEYERTYSHRGMNREFELVTCRMTATVFRGSDRPAGWIAEQERDNMQVERNVYFGPAYGMMATPVMTRASLIGRTSRGPMIVQEYDTSIVVPPDCTAALDTNGNLILDIDDQSKTMRNKNA